MRLTDRIRQSTAKGAIWFVATSAHIYFPMETVNDNYLVPYKREINIMEIDRTKLMKATVGRHDKLSLFVPKKLRFLMPHYREVKPA